jgi:hypothetical protein
LYGWTPRAAAILETAKRLEFDHIASAEIQQLFGIDKHAAHRLLRAFGGELHAGRLFLRKSDLLNGLRATIRGTAYANTRSRLERIGRKMEEWSRQHPARAVKTKMRREELAFQTVAGLPDTIRLGPGNLWMEFADLPDFVAQLMKLAHAAINDLPALEASISRSSSRQS